MRAFGNQEVGKVVAKEEQANGSDQSIAYCEKPTVILFHPSDFIGVCTEALRKGTLNRN